MNALDRKLFRDLWHWKTQMLAIALVMASGIAMLVMSRCTLTSLERTRDAYYDRTRFADLFANLKRAPNALAERIRGIPGVAQAQLRVVADVTLDLDRMPEPAIGRMISIDPGDREGLNDLYLREGRFPDPARAGEVLVGEAFATAHRLKPGDRIRAVVNGRLLPLTIAGIALSPEYVFSIRSGDLIPDDRGFGVFWMPRVQLGPLFDMDGAFNDLALRLSPGASAREVIRRLDVLLAPYGGGGAYGREDHVSHRFLHEELEQLRNMGTLPPAIFLAVAAFLLNAVLSRLLGLQREQIATLKAFGYTRREIGLHFIQMSVFLAATALLLGTLFGAWLGRGLTGIYVRFYHFPILEFLLDPGVFAVAAAVACAAAALGALGAVRRATRVSPSEGMRPEPPPIYTAAGGNGSGFSRFLGYRSRMVQRHLRKSPWRTASSILGLAMAVAIYIMSSFFIDAVDHVIAHEFFLVQRQDVSVGLKEAAGTGVIGAFRSLPGVLRAEPYREVPVRLRSGHRSRRSAILGLDPSGTLHELQDAHGKPLKLPGEGIVLSEKLAEILRVSPGDRLTVEVLEGRRTVREVPVAALSSGYVGLSAHMDVRALGRLLREGPAASGAFLAVDSAKSDALNRALKETPRVATVTVKRSVLSGFRETIAENLLRMVAFSALFAAVIAVGVVYNGARISLSEHARELSSLRVLGFTRGEVFRILLQEMALLAAVALPLGVVLGRGLAWITVQGLQTEVYRFPLVILPRTYASACAIVVAASVISALIARIRIDRLDLLSTLKAPE